MITSLYQLPPLPHGSSFHQFAWLLWFFKFWQARKVTEQQESQNRKNSIPKPSSYPFQLVLLSHSLPSADKCLAITDLIYHHRFAFSRIHFVYMASYNIYPFAYGLFHFADAFKICLCCWMSHSVSSDFTEIFHCIKIPHSVSSTHQLMDMWVVFSFCQFWIKVLWKLQCKSFCGHIFHFSWLST